MQYDSSSHGIAGADDPPAARLIRQWLPARAACGFNHPASHHGRDSSMSIPGSAVTARFGGLIRSWSVHRLAKSGPAPRCGSL
jgi:hypothetical protein